MTTDRRPLLSLEEALERLVAGAGLQALQPRGDAVETIDTFDALGRVLAVDVRSLIDVPPEDNTAMDGYALRCADVPTAGTLLPVSQRIPAGHVGQPLQPGTAARIFTGGQVPAGADAVVMQEQCEAVATASVMIQVVPKAGQWIRRRSEDVAAGDVVLRAGQRLTPQALGMAASVGAGRLTVWRRLRVAIFSTGDELMMPGQPLRPGAIYNSNRYTLRALLHAAGCEVDDLGIVVDTLDATREALRRAAVGNDLVLTCGGVSVGEEDHLKPAVEAEGELEQWRIAIKPGKPLAFGRIRRPVVADGSESDAGAASEALFVGLPGNPVSAFVTHVLAVSTVLRTLQGMDPALPKRLPMRADFEWPRPDRRREFLRVRINAAGGLDLFANQSSGVLTSTVWADGLLDNPAGQAIARGDSVQFLPLSELVSH